MATPPKHWKPESPAFSAHRPALISRARKPRTICELLDGIDAPLLTIASKLGICERTLRAIRTGAHRPRRRSRLRICLGLGLSLDQLDALLDAQAKANRVPRRAAL